MRTGLGLIGPLIDAILARIPGQRDITRPNFRILRDSVQTPRLDPAPQSSTAVARIGAVNLGRIAWLLTALACLVAVLILVLEGYYGYAGVTLAVAVSAAINII
jgi:hypothetical protein